jgi:hypothetical protein
LFWASFASGAKLVLLFYHQPRESGISAAWIFLRSSVATPCVFACSCTDLMTRLLFHEISGMLEWTLSWDWPSCRLSVVVAESTSSELDLRRQSWFSQCDIISSCWIHNWFIPHEELSRVSEAIVFRERHWFELWWPWCSLQPYGEWWFRIHKLRNYITREEIFFRGSSVLTRILVWWVLPQWAILLFFHFFNFSLYSFNLLFCLIKFLKLLWSFFFACSWFANLSFSFWSWCIFWCTISSSLSTD